MQFKMTGAFQVLYTVLFCISITDGLITASDYGDSSDFKDRDKRELRPCKDKFQKIGTHTACLPPSDKLKTSGVNDADKKLIVALHNQYRGKVNPPASNMLKLTWDDEIAMIAQAWASNCKVEHDKGSDRNIPGRLTVGQNYGANYKNWSSCIKGWYDEFKTFRYGGQNQAIFHSIGHYTQLVWAESSKVGCGFADCGTSTFYVCDYGPAGNLGSIDKPYKSGSFCGECEAHCVNHLCDCGEHLCENGAPTIRSNCTCSCKQPFQIGNSCQLDCAAAADKQPSYCGEGQYNRQGCDTYANVADDCPVTCEVCPYGGFNYTEGTHTVSGALPTGHLYDEIILLLGMITFYIMFIIN